MAAGQRYGVAGRDVGTDRPIGELALFELPGSGPAAPGPGSASQIVFSGSGWVADGQRRVECRIDDRAFRIEVGGVGELWVRLDGQCIGCSRLAPGIDPGLLRLALLGPALTLALAAQGTFCLHASAVEAGSGVLAFAGESGAGKSTLARRLAGSPPLACRRVADDILPLELESNEPMARSDFPQLKLAHSEQPCLTGPSSLPLRAVFLLQPPAASKPSGSSVRVEPLAAGHSTLALVRHTVASRLFAATLLERHLRFCAELAERVPVARLSYPWSEEALPALAEALAGDLG